MRGWGWEEKRKCYVEGGYLSSTFRGVWAGDTNCKLLEFDAISKQETKRP